MLHCLGISDILQNEANYNRHISLLNRHEQKHAKQNVIHCHVKEMISGAITINFKKAELV